MRMNQRVEKYYEAQFAALELLRRDATASELEFYRIAEAELREGYEFERVLPAELTPKSLIQRRTRLQRYIARLEYELGLPELGLHWHHWAREEIVNALEKLSETQDQLEALGIEQGRDSSPPPDRAALERELERGALNTKLEELRMLHGLKTAWLERRGATAEAIRDHDELERLTEEIERVSSQLAKDGFL
jgi:hypothetical protein